MPTLQVKVEDRLLAVLRKKARAIGLTQAEYVTRWLEGLAGGVSAENPAISSEGAGSNEEPVVGIAGSAVASTPPADRGLLEELQKQTALLEQLVAANTEKPAIPAAGGGPVVVTDEPLKAAEVVITPPAPEQPEQSGEQGPVHTTEQVAVAAPADVQGGDDLLAAQRARQLQELEKWRVQQSAAVKAANQAERREALAAAGQVVADAAPAAVEERKPNPAFAEQLKAAAEAVRAQAAEAPGMGGNQVDDEEEAASMPAMSEPAVLTPADVCELVLEVEAAPVDPAGDDLEARVAAMEALDRAMEDWLDGIRAGGDPVAPPLPADASDQEWQDAAEAAVTARGRKPLPELTEAALKYWGRG